MPFAWIQAGTALLGAYESTQGGGGGGGSGGGSGGNGAPPVYIGKNQGGMDDSFNSNFNGYQKNINDSYGQMQPFMQQNFQNQYNNPMNGALMMGAQNSGAQYGAASGQLNQNAQNMYGAGNQAYMTGFDPRGNIYNQNRNDLTENVRSGEYARGISMSPAGASVEADSLGRFQNQWQNEQQGRQLAGLQGMGRAYGEGANMQGTAAQYAGMAGSVPYAAQNQIFQDQRGAVSDFNSAQQPYLQGLQQLQSNSLSYLNHGQSAQNQAFNQNRQNNQDQNQMWQQLGGLGNQIGGQVKNWWAGNQGDMSSHDYGSSYDPYQSSMTGGYDPQGL